MVEARPVRRAPPGPHERARHAIAGGGCMPETGAAVVIPARLESTRLPRKLLLRETGRPVIAHTVERVLAARAASGGAITRVLVAADDEEIAHAAREAGAEAVLTRRDHRSGTDRIAEAAASIPEGSIVNVQGDEAEVDPAHVVAAARLLSGGDETPEPMGTLAYALRSRAELDNPDQVKVVTGAGGRALYFSRAPIPFPRDGDKDETGAWGLGHIGIYVYRKEFLLRYSKLPPSKLEEREKLEQLRAVEAGEPIRVAVVSPPRGRPIDTREDYDEFCRRLGGGAK